MGSPGEAMQCMASRAELTSHPRQPDIDIETISLHAQLRRATQQMPVLILTRPHTDPDPPLFLCPSTSRSPALSRPESLLFQC